MGSQPHGQVQPGDSAPALADQNRLRAAIAEAFELLAAGAPHKALAHIRPVTDLAGRTDVGAYAVGLIYFNADDPRTALGWFDRTLAINPSNVEALAARAVVLQRLGQPKQALDSYEAILALRPDDVETMFDIGLALQSLGRMSDALSAYEHVSRADPNHVEALSNRGLLLERFQRFEEALACFAALEALRPDDASNLVHKASVLHRLGRHEDALAAYEAAATRSPQDTDTEVSRGNLLLELGRFGEAIECYDRALLDGQVQPRTILDRGIALEGLGRIEAALEAYDAALASEPGFYEALWRRGRILHELGRLVDARACYDEALKVRPSFVPALVDRAMILLRCGHYQDAVTSCSEALQNDPRHALASRIRGAALRALGRLDEALDALDHARELDPSVAELWLERADVLNALDRRDDSVACYREALRLRPCYPEAASRLGMALKHLGRVDEALAAFDDALLHVPSSVEARMGRAETLLLSGLLKAGFEDFESRFDHRDAPPKAVVSALPVWDGGDLTGKAILVFEERGASDIVQFARYLPYLAELGADVTFLCRKNMHRLLASLAGRIRLVETADPTAGFDLQCPLLSLARGFRTSLDTIPAPIPYLRAEPDLVARWAERIGSDGFRIGICRHGAAFANRSETVPAAIFAPLAAIDGVRLFGLGKEPEPCEVEAKGHRFVVEGLGPEFDAGPDSFIDCAAVMASLDLVVTTDTAIAHVAGALGRPVLLALEQTAGWHWLRERDDSPWYPTMRLFRQTRKGDWDDVFERVARWVAPLAAARNVTRRPARTATRIDIPVSVGEFIDKITILELEEHHASAAERADIRRELAHLRMLRLEAGLGSAKLRALEAELGDINARLHRLDDELRMREASGEFDAKTADLAWHVSRTHRARAELKQAIDALFHSPMGEARTQSILQRGPGT
jgi:tetratricopeptide (TPR) repeat protein